MKLRVLGPLEVVGADGPVALPAAKHRRLLAALAIARNHTLSADALIDAIWGERPPASARKLVQVYVSQLRKTLPSGVEIATEPGGYTLTIAPEHVDAFVFERYLAEAGAALEADNPALAASVLTRAIGLWRGPAFADVVYEDFARAEASRLEELRIVAAEQRADALLRMGRPGEALAALQAVAEENPLRERVHELLMLALYVGGRQTDALDVYTSLRQRLDDELGLEPGAPLRRLQERILRQDASLQPTPAKTPRIELVPSPPSGFVGRSRELGELRRLLGRHDVRLVTVTGAGGSGKTRLALQVAREVVSDFANGAAFVELGPLRDADLVATTIAQTLGVKESADEPVIETLATSLRARELLLVIDNAEHLQAAAALYVKLLSSAPRLKILITTRAVLHLSGEHVFPLDPLVEDEAVELFAQRAKALAPDFDVRDDNRSDVREICRRVDRMPLAIELAAARIGTLSPHELLDRLADRLTVLTGGPRDLPARQQTLRETLAWSVDLLDHDQRNAFARLGVFHGGARLAAAEQVCEAGLDTLESLVDNNLLRRAGTDGEPRFVLLETVREYALELLGENRIGAEEAHARYMAELAEAADLRGSEQPHWFGILDAEHENLRAAIDTSVARGDHVTELRLIGALWRYWWIRGYLAEGRERVQTALDRGTHRDTDRYSGVLYGGGILAWSVGDYARGRALAKQLLVRSESGSVWDEFAGSKLLAMIALRERDFESSERYSSRTLTLARTLGDQAEILIAKLNHAVLYLDWDRLDIAVPMLEDVLAEYQRGGIVEGLALASLNLGEAEYRRGEYDRARQHFEAARAAFGSIGFRTNAGHATQGLAAVEASTGSYEVAARLLGEAASVLTEVGAPDAGFAPWLVAKTEEATRAAIGDTTFAEEYAKGHAGATGTADA